MAPAIRGAILGAARNFRLSPINKLCGRGSASKWCLLALQPRNLNTRQRCGRMKYALAAMVLLLAACQRENASGLTQEQAEAKLLDQGYTYPTIGPSPEGYTGYAMRHGAKIKVTIGKHGAVTPEPGG